MHKAKDLRDQSVEELLALEEDLSKESYHLKSELRVNRKLEKPHLLIQNKKDRARVLTILREKQGNN